MSALGHRSHQSTTRRWCRLDRNLDKEIKTLAEELGIPYRSGGAMITVGITRKSSTGEYRVFWRDEQGRDDEAKAYYTDDEEDAVNTMLDIVERTQTQGVEIRTATTLRTVKLLNKYHPTYLSAPQVMKGVAGPPPFETREEREYVGPYAPYASAKDKGKAMVAGAESASEEHVRQMAREDRDFTEVLGWLDRQVGYNREARDWARRVYNDEKIKGAGGMQSGEESFADAYYKKQAEEGRP